MKAKPIIPRKLALRDVDEAVAFYLAEGAPEAALGFIEALETGYIHLSRHPGTGSPRYGHELDLPGLRTWPLTRFPFLIFYVERSESIDVWRILHGQRDIAAWMQDPQIS